MHDACNALIQEKTVEHEITASKPKKAIPSILIIQILFVLIFALLAEAINITKPVSAALVSAHQDWAIESVSSMKQTKDVICTQDSLQFIQKWVSTAKTLGINYISVETPYDNPSCGNAVAYTKTWLSVIRSQGLHVWHRHMSLSFEGIYGVKKSATKNYINQISNYIKANPTFFQAGDIFTPTPEPQNGGIAGINCDPHQSICVFRDAARFNKWLRDAMTASTQAFQSIGLGGKIKIGYYGFDGFIAWGDNNPDWHGILEDATVQQMGNITIDHYPEAVGDTMSNDLNELQAKYPTTPIVIGEWGTIMGGNIKQQVRDSMSAAKRPNVVGFNYWHLGPGGCGYESLVSNNFTPCTQFIDVQSFFTGMS